MDYLSFRDTARTMSIDVDNFEFSKLEVYFDFLVDYNEKINLTAITQRDDVFLLHFLDSLSAIKHLPQGASICDVGTGAGFPGVVLKIFRPDLQLTLVDSLNKRIKFLTELCEKLDIKATCLHSRSEDVAKTTLRENFDVVVSRAVANLNTLYEYALPLVKIGGQFIAYKADCESELFGSQNVPKLLGAKFDRTENFTLPIKNAVRTLVFCTKTAPTPSKYPRGGNKERQDPLK